jgi:hypothetical protein
MPTPRNRRRRSLRQPKPDRVRVLELLASCPDGCSEALLIAHGVTVAQMVELVSAGLATATPQALKSGRLKVLREI